MRPIGNTSMIELSSLLISGSNGCLQFFSKTLRLKLLCKLHTCLGTQNLTNIQGRMGGSVG